MEPANDLIAIRRQKLEALRAAGVAPFGAKFEVPGRIEEILAAFSEGGQFGPPGESPRTGTWERADFSIFSDYSGRMQIFVHAKEIGEAAMAIFKQLDIGDWIGVEGEWFTTKTGEPTIRVKR